MKVLVTGANGFVGKNVCAALNARAGEYTCLPFDIDSDPALLPQYAQDCDFVLHLAGVNRPRETDEFMRGNFGFTSRVLDCLRAAGNRAPVLITSSTQAALDNPYGESKRAGEELLRAYGTETGAPVYIYRMPNVFGKWSRPNYNSAVATFCFNIARDLPITVNDRETALRLVYIDDVVRAFLETMAGRPLLAEGFCQITPVHCATLGRIVDLLTSFRDMPGTRLLPDFADPFVKALYSTYVSFLPPEDGFAYPLVEHADARGSFTELFRTVDRGQVSVNVSRPGIVKGGHWHHTKTEKFVVVTGRGVVRFRGVYDEKVYEYPVDAADKKVVDIPPGYTHEIENTGDGEMVTVMWANELFDPDNPDTIPLKV